MLRSLPCPLGGDDGVRRCVTTLFLVRHCPLRLGRCRDCRSHSNQQPLCSQGRVAAVNERNRLFVSALATFFSLQAREDGEKEQAPPCLPSCSHLHPDIMASSSTVDIPSNLLERVKAFRMAKRSASSSAIVLKINKAQLVMELDEEYDEIALEDLEEGEYEEERGDKTCKSLGAIIHDVDAVRSRQYETPWWLWAGPPVPTSILSTGSGSSTTIQPIADADSSEII